MKDGQVVDEDPWEVRRLAPPRVCSSCLVGANAADCPDCGEPMTALSRPARSLMGAMAWP